MPLAIRPARPDDAAVIAAYNRHLAAESENKVLDADVVDRGVRAALADPNKCRYFVAEEDNIVVGQTMITFEWSDWHNGWHWWIQSVYVRPESRRRGIFRALYEHVLNAARADPEVVALRLYVERGNEKAQQTYLRLGMAWTGYGLMERYPL